MNEARSGSAAVVLNRGTNAGKVLTIGGSGSGVAVLASTELHDPVTNTFAPPNATPTLNLARGNVTATALENGKLLVYGSFVNGGNPGCSRSSSTI